MSLSTINEGAFPEFIASSLGRYALHHRLFDGREAYAASAASGELLGACARDNRADKTRCYRRRGLDRSRKSRCPRVRSSTWRACYLDVGIPG